MFLSASWPAYHKNPELSTPRVGEIPQNNLSVLISDTYVPALDTGPFICHTISIKRRVSPTMSVIEINYGKGWERTCYKPMSMWDAYTIAERLAKAYTEYQYRVVDEAR